MSAPHPLDNMAWHALDGPQADLAESASIDGARRFRRAVAPFSAVDELDADGWRSLAELVGPGGVAILFRAEVTAPPPAWTTVFQGTTIQYQAAELDPIDAATAAEIVELGPDDSTGMVELVARTEPGPFSAETWRTGRYFGIRRAGRLVAMAGERLRTDGWGEVSAVCVDESLRGQGLGAVMTLAAARAITERGDRPMLHVAEDNHPAHRLYLQIGFEVRRSVVAGGYRFTG
ncbi:MAG: GNAT family N-acetyltransferase [Actinomycetota bacterium]